MKYRQMRKYHQIDVYIYQCAVYLFFLLPGDDTYFAEDIQSLCFDYSRIWGEDLPSKINLRSFLHIYWPGFVMQHFVSYMVLQSYMTSRLGLK